MEEFLKSGGREAYLKLPEESQLSGFNAPPDEWRQPAPSPESVAEFKRERNLRRWLSFAAISAFLLVASIALLELLG